jgi:hypothetical protein
MAVEGAALLAAAIRAAIQAKAPRRTVQAIAAAVTGVLVRPSAAASLDFDATGPAGTTVEETRAKRSAQRQRKKLRRRSASAKAACAAPTAVAEVLQRLAVRAEATVVDPGVVGGMAHGVRGSKRRKKGGNAKQPGGGALYGDVVSWYGGEVLQRKAVRASSSMEIANDEVLDDYWADEGGHGAGVGLSSIGAGVLQCDAVRAPAPMDVVGAEELDVSSAKDACDDSFMEFVNMKYEGLHLGAIVEQYAKLKHLLESARSIPGGLRGRVEALALASVREFQGKLGFNAASPLVAVVRRDG